MVVVYRVNWLLCCCCLYSKLSHFSEQRKSNLTILWFVAREDPRLNRWWPSRLYQPGNRIVALIDCTATSTTSTTITDATIGRAATFPTTQLQPRDCVGDSRLYQHICKLSMQQHQQLHQLRRIPVHCLRYPRSVPTFHAPWLRMASLFPIRFLANAETARSQSGAISSYDLMWCQYLLSFDHRSADWARTASSWHMSFASSASIRGA